MLSAWTSPTHSGETKKLDDRQEQVLKVMGKDVITRLSRYFNNDPILQRLDVAQAAPIHEQNVSAVEELFVDNYWEQLSEIDCKLFGSRACQSYVQPPAMGFWRGYVKQITDVFTFQPVVQAAHIFKKPTDDAAAPLQSSCKTLRADFGLPAVWRPLRSSLPRLSSAERIR